MPGGKLGRANLNYGWFLRFCAGLSMITFFDILSFMPMTVDEFGETRVSPEYRSIVTMLRGLMREMAPDATEAISYGIPVYTRKHGIAVISPTKKCCHDPSATGRAIHLANWNPRSRKEFVTTKMDEKAIAAAASQGALWRNPATATGTSNRL
jgi:hypothetical protein